MAASDLAQLIDVKAWLGERSSGDDVLLGRLITDVSSAIYAYLGRPLLLPHTVTERYDGSGKRRLYLRQFPVLAITSLIFDDLAIPAVPAPSIGASWPRPGYLLEPWDGAPPGGIQAIDLYGRFAFVSGRQNVAVTYSAGYQVSGEAATVPNGGNIAALAPYGPWVSDQGVVYGSTGLPLTAIAPGTTPVQGQYSITNGAYIFSAADANAAVLISYGFIPAAINNACIEWVAERFRYRSHIGASSENIAGVISWQFSLKGVPDFITASLDPYRNVAPI